jgi:hypothetical protein
MNKFTSWLTVFLVVIILIPLSSLLISESQPTREENQFIGPVAIEEINSEDDDTSQVEPKPYYPDFPELPPPPYPGVDFYDVASPPPSYINNENRASRIKVNTSTVISIDSPKHMEFVTLGQNFIVSGGLYEDNNSNGKNDTGDLPIPNAVLHLRWAYSPSTTEVTTDINGHFTATVPNENKNLDPKPLPLEIEFWGQWTINGSVYFQIPRNNSLNIQGFDDDGDNPQYESDGQDNDGDWDINLHDINKNGVADINFDGTQFNNDDAGWKAPPNNDVQIDEEWNNGSGKPRIDDDGDGFVDEDCDSGANLAGSTDDDNGDGDPSYDPEPNVDEPGEGIDEEGVPDGIDNDGDLQIDEDVRLPFVPRQNTTTKINLIIQHRGDISLSLSKPNALIGETVTVSGRFKDPDLSTPITGKWIILKFHNHIIHYVKTDDEGKFSYDYTILSEINGDRIEVGSRQFAAVFDQTYLPDNTTYYKSTSNKISISLKRPTKIEITNVYKDVYLQDTISVSGRVTDETGERLLISIVNDDGTRDTIETSDYKVTLMWGPSAASWAPPPKPGFLGPEGNFTITFELNNPLQPLGRVEVSATFLDLTDKYYLPDFTFDEFTVRAHSKIVDWEEVKGFHRGETAYVRGRLVRSDGSIVQGLQGAQLEARWGSAGPFENLTEETRAEGAFTYVYDIENDHQLGPVVVYMKFDGSNYLQGYVDGFDHTESFAHKTYYVIAQPRITLEGGDIIKGQTFKFQGSLHDDAGNPMPNQYIEIYFSSRPIVNPETGEWEPDDLPIAFIPTDSTGSFEYEHTLDQTFEVGRAYGAARFKGFQPPYNATNAYDEANTWNVEFNVSAETSIVLDSDYTEEDLFRGRDFVIKGRVFETYLDHIVPDKKVKPQHGEKLTVNVFMRASGVSNATVYTIGDATVGKLGIFQVRAKVPAEIEITEAVEVSLVFNGNIRYQGSENRSVHKLWGSIFFDRSVILDSFPDTDPKTGRKAVHEQKFNHKSKSYEGPWIVQVPVFEDIQGRAPPPVPNATIYLNFSGDYFVNTSMVYTDDNGVATFEFVNPLKDKDYPDRIKLLYREKESYVLEVTVSFVGSTGLQAAQTSFNITYYPTPPPPPLPMWERYGTYISLLVIITIILVIFMIVFSSWYIKQQRLRGLKRIIKRAADQLVAGDQYRATIYKSYKKLSAHLRRYGYLRREAETFREFENAIRQALPIDRISMHRFLDLLEEARYSTHKIGEVQRQAAISNLRAIEGSLSQIIIDEEAAMRALRKLEEEEKAMAAAETEIIVKPGAEGGKPGAPMGGQPPLPPGGTAGQPKMLPPGKQG